jgi:hypothetical protein
MGGKYLPHKLSPLKKHIGDVKRVEYPSPLGITESKVGLSTSGLRVSNVATIQIGEEIEDTDNGKDPPVELKTQISRYTGPRVEA